MNVKATGHPLLRTADSPLFITIRVMVGAVFLSEGIQKFLYPDACGAGRFLRIGIPAPEVMAPFVGCMEILSGCLMLAGFLTRFAALVTLVIMVVAIVSTKIPILLGEGYWGFSVAKLSRYGFWAMAHEARTDWSMLLGSLFLLFAGAGRWSVDRALAKSPPARGS